MILFVFVEAFGQQPTSYWVRIFSVSSYMQYFNVDTDVVVNRLLSSLNPVGGDFFNKIDANPDLWVILLIPFFFIFNNQNRDTHCIKCGFLTLGEKVKNYSWQLNCSSKICRRIKWPFCFCHLFLSPFWCIFPAHPFKLFTS